MLRLPTLALLGGLFMLSGGLVGQEAKKDDPKAVKKDEPKAAKKDDAGAKVKGFLPQNWGKIGLSDDQKQEIYKIQAKHNAEIEKLEAQIREHKAARTKELNAVLSPDQKKRLEEVLLGKDKK